MKKKFECKTCKKQFEADDSGYVVCPHCHSDNVELYSHNVSARTWKIAGAIVVILLVCGAYFLATTRTKGSSTLDNPHPVEPDTISDPPTVNVGMPVLNDDGMYSVEVKGNNISQGTKYYYVMMSHFGKQVLQKNNDGHFSNIPFCPDDGNSYDFAIMDGKADTLLCIPVEQTGFIKQAIIDEEDRMTTGQLQTLIVHPIEKPPPTFGRRRFFQCLVADASARSRRRRMSSLLGRMSPALVSAHLVITGPSIS